MGIVVVEEQDKSNETWFVTNETIEREREREGKVNMNSVEKKAM